MRSTCLIFGFCAALISPATILSPSSAVTADLPDIALVPRDEIRWKDVVVEAEPPVEVWVARFKV